MKFMKMNKTPMQELIDNWEDIRTNLDKSVAGIKNDLVLSLLLIYVKEQLEKEKQFAFDCFEAGYKARHYFSAGDGDNAFEIFYSQCAEQHTK